MASRILLQDNPDANIMDEGEQKLFIILSIIYFEAVWLPLLIYKLYKLMQYKNTTEFRKRHPVYLFILYFIVLWHIAIQQPFCLLILYPSDTFFAESNYNYSSLTGGIIHILTFFFILGFLLLFLARSWILYHDYRFNDCVANLCWRLEIQPSYEHDNWWISKRSIYGNPKYILAIMITLWFILLTIYCVIYFTVGDGTNHPQNDEIEYILGWMMAVFATIPVLISYAVVVLKIREITDVFNIRRELIYTNRICLLCVALFFLMLIICLVIGISMDSAPMVCTQSIVTCTAGGIIIFFNIKYIGKSAEINKDNNNNNDNDDNSDDRECYNIPDLALEDVLEDRTGFECFMKHLVLEFSVENLLFIAEVQQFRSTLDYQVCGKELSEIPDVPILRLNWLPLSVGLKTESPWLRASYIYAKFICKTAKYQVNISHRVWTECTAFFPELNGLNDTNNVAALPTKGGNRKMNNSINYKNSINYSISSTIPQSKKKQLMEEEKNKINRRIEKGRFRALSEKYIKKRKNKKLKKRIDKKLELLEPPNNNNNDNDNDNDNVEEMDIYSSNSSHVVHESGDIELDYPATRDIMDRSTMSRSTELVSFKYELYHVFDSAEKEVWLLMKDSLTRYQQTDTYKKMAIDNKNNNNRLSIGSSNYGMNNFWKGLTKNISISKGSTNLKQPLLNDNT